MSTYADIRNSRRLVKAGIAMAYALAVVVAFVNLRADYGSVLSAIGFLAMLSIPPTMAVYSLDRRPGLLTAAGIAAFFQGLLLLGSGIGLLNVIVVVLWYLAAQRRPRPAVAPKWATWVRPILGFVAILPLLVMFMHLDPGCRSVDSDGTVTIEETTQFPSGWRFFSGAGSDGTASEASDGVVLSCTSDIVQPWEALLSIAVTIAILQLQSRWPTADQADRKLETSSTVPAG